MNLVRTTSVSLIRSVFFHPAIKPEVMDDDMEIIVHEKIYWLLAYVDGALVGLVMFCPIYSLAWNPHIAIFPHHRGCGTEVMKQGVRWMFDNTPCNKLIAFPFKPIMKRVYEKCGFTIEGNSRGLLTIRGQQIDCQIVGIEK